MFVNNGQIVESGTHDELLEKNGEYLKLVRNQLIIKSQYLRCLDIHLIHEVRDQIL